LSAQAKRLPTVSRNLSFNFILSISHVLIPLLSIPYVSRVLDPEGIGRVSFIDSFTYYFIAIAEFGIVVYGIREIARIGDVKADRDRLLSELLGLHIRTSAVALLIYAVAVFFVWHEIRDTTLLLLSIGVLLVNAFSCEWYFIGTSEFRYITIRSLITRLLGLLSIYLLVKRPDDYQLYYAAIAVSGMANGISNMVLLFRKVNVRADIDSWRKHIPFVKVTYGISLTYGATLFLDNVLLGLIGTAASVGLYSFAVKVVRIGTGVITDTLLVFFPSIIKSMSSDEESRTDHVLSQNFQLILLLAIPLSVGIFLLSEEIILVIFGAKFLPAIITLRILAAFPILKAFNLFLSRQILIAKSLEKVHLRNLFFSSVAFLVMAGFGAYWWQDKGVATALMLSELLLLLLTHRSVVSLAGARTWYRSRPIIQASFGSLLFVPLVYFLRAGLSDNLYLLVSATCICIITYALYLVFAVRNEVSIRIFKKITGALRLT
jgi:O-antigen/teichoic acid export membrane protein